MRALHARYCASVSCPARKPPTREIPGRKLSAERLWKLCEGQDLGAPQIVDDLDLDTDAVVEAVYEMEWYEPRSDAIRRTLSVEPLNDDPDRGFRPDGGRPDPPVIDDGTIDLEQVASPHNGTLGPITPVCNVEQSGMVRFGVDAVRAPVFALEHPVGGLVEHWGESVLDTIPHAGLADQFARPDDERVSILVTSVHDWSPGAGITSSPRTKDRLIDRPRDLEIREPRSAEATPDSERSSDCQSDNDGNLESVHGHTEETEGIPPTLPVTTHPYERD